MRYSGSGAPSGLTNGRLFDMVRTLAKTLTLAAAFLPLAAFGAEYAVTPESGSFGVGDKITAKIQIVPASGESVNTGDGTLTFNKALLQVDSISKDGSAFSLWTAEPKYSNADGTVDWSGGTPQAFSRNSTVLTVVFIVKSPGAAELAFSKGSILAADGKGTDVYKGGKTASYTLTEQTTPPEEEPIVSEPPGDPPGTPEITSSTHEKSDAWYSANKAVFAWKATSDVDAVRLIFSKEENATPNVVHEPPLSTRTIEDIEDGVWWFAVSLRNESGWGKTGKKKIQIDTVPPEEFGITYSEEDIAFLFEAEDKLSGIAKYELVVGALSPITILATDLKDGKYAVPPQDGGEQKVTVTAFDQASNKREASGTFTLPLVKKPEKPKVIEEEEEKEPFFTSEVILLLFFVFATGVATSMYYLEKSKSHKEHALVLKELVAVREKSDKIFSALQEEIEEQITNLNDKPQPTPEERAVLESLHEALDMSEELVAMEIEELRRKVRNSE